MAKKTLLVTLEIEVADLTDEQRRDLAQSGQCEESAIPCLDDHSAEEIADVVAGIGAEGMSDELFGGSEVYARITEARVIEAKWAGPALTDRVITKLNEIADTLEGIADSNEDPAQKLADDIRELIEDIEAAP